MDYTSQNVGYFHQYLINYPHINFIISKLAYNNNNNKL